MGFAHVHTEKKRFIKVREDEHSGAAESSKLARLSEFPKASWDLAIRLNLEIDMQNPAVLRNVLGCFL